MIANAKLYGTPFMRTHVKSSKTPTVAHRVAMIMGKTAYVCIMGHGSSLSSRIATSYHRTGGSQGMLNIFQRDGRDGPDLPPSEAAH